MDDISLEDDLDSAAMAEAMGFTGFGMQRSNKKRKFNPNADSSVDGSSGEPFTPATTGANTAPLGRRRPMALPPPASGVFEGGGNADEVDLDEGGNEDGARRRGGGGDDVVIVGDNPGPQYIDTSRDVLPKAMEGMEMQSRINAIVEGNANPAGTTSNHQEPQYQQYQTDKGTRWSGPHAHAHAAKAAGLPWWEGAWDPKLIDRMIENPWEKLEKQGGFDSRGTWGRKDGGIAGEMAVAGETGAQAVGVASEAGLA
ncbi:hypothetical protein VP1G_00746 [Cytospora mali]|uniref:Uncharacterized protein n=1 Tax=Cytospora mali TaxID=578113 RepID=A0A194UNE0_CYTMA|nr:hypothetical protein VP1G_00746 [Valsa mali var. pyri (nom. inval.)]